MLCPSCHYIIEKNSVFYLCLASVHSVRLLDETFQIVYSKDRWMIINNSISFEWKHIKSIWRRSFCGNITIFQWDDKKSTWEKYDLHNQQIYWLQDKNKNVNVTKCTHNMFIILIKTGLFLGVFFFSCCAVYTDMFTLENEVKNRMITLNRIFCLKVTFGSLENYRPTNWMISWLWKCEH